MNRTGLFALLLLAITVTSCTTEKRLARRYVKHHDGNGIMVVPLYELLKDNYTVSYDTAIRYTPEQLDSMAWAQSSYVRMVSDSVFLTLYTNSLVKQLSKYGYDLYVDGGAEAFLSLPDPKWMLQIDQLQLIENYKVEEKQISTARGDIYSKPVKINELSLSSWLTVNRANSGTKQTLFLETYSQDKVKNRLTVFNDELALEAVRDSLGMDGVYQLAVETGLKHAELLFDYFMNDYIRINLPAGVTNRQLFHYNIQRNKLKRGLKQRFDVVG